MCGISGFTFPDEEKIQRMNQAIAHRGPDQEGVYVDERVSLGHRRLSIIDLSDAGRNPFWSEDGNLAIIFNGELYNYKDIREELRTKGYRFRTETDTEVLLYAYHCWEKEMFKKFNGMWAFAIYDKKKQKLILSRGRLGKKPLYYHYDGQNLIFASEIKAILEHDIDRSIDVDAVNAFIRLTYIPQPLTIFRSIKKMPPATYAEFDLKDRILKLYPLWKIDPMPDLKESEDEIAERVRTLFIDAVGKRLIADRPLGFFLSGGIDSTSVLAAAHSLKGEGLKTFSVRFSTTSQEEKYNRDAELAKKTSDYFKTEHTEYTVGTKEILENIEAVIHHMDEPISNATFVATYLLAREAKKKVTVILGGDGGDELFGGYPKYRASLQLAQYSRIPRPLRTHFFSPILKKVLSPWKDLSRGLDPELGIDWYLYFQSEPEGVINPLLVEDKNRPQAVRNLLEHLYFQKKYSLEDMQKKIMLTDIQTWLTDEEMMRSDKMTMAWGIEQRAPLLDYRLVELSAQIPTRMKIKGKELKSIFKKAMGSMLPPHVIEASREKRGFFSPTSKWIREELRTLAYDMLSEESLKKTGFFNPKEVHKMLEGHMQGGNRGAVVRTGINYSPTILWSLIIFQLWHKHFIRSK